MSTRTAPLNRSHTVGSGKLRAKLLLHVGGMSLANASPSFTAVAVPPAFPTTCRRPWPSIKALTKDLYRDIRLTQPLAPLKYSSQPRYKSFIHFTGPRHAAAPQPPQDADLDNLTKKQK
ncbi:hypothetical protein G6011_11331 [Alternaria panax]|uniref:Uncharacterized protein n=1 Tax=Alternaria panax TaxID=48097 RepID=A0AAD4ID78_9PLEO|nr:hypothetical protein G6011_11331 [Alternaria panax]